MLQAAGKSGKEVMRSMKKHAWAIGFTACLTAFTVFLAMDTFVLSSNYQTNATQMNTSMIRQAEAEVYPKPMIAPRLHCL